MRYVLDTDVIVAAMRSPSGASAALLLAALDRRFTLVANVPLIIEYEATCSRVEHRIAASLSANEVQQFLDGLASGSGRTRRNPFPVASTFARSGG